MAKQDKITELFRDNAHKLDQQPSEATWARLEQRLRPQGSITERRSQIRTPGRVTRFNNLRIAAGLALLIGLSAVFLWLLNEQDRRYQRAVATTDRALDIEDLKVDAAAVTMRPSPTVQQSLEEAYRLPQKKIEEGTPEQKLVAKTTAASPAQLPPAPSRSDSADANQRTGR